MPWIITKTSAKEYDPSKKQSIEWKAESTNCQYKFQPMSKKFDYSHYQQEEDKKFIEAVNKAIGKESNNQPVFDPNDIVDDFI